jgi:putative acetyltransferase
MSRNIKKLEQAGLVETYQDTTDKRRKIITLSAQGEKLLAETTESINKTIANIAEILNEDEIEAIINSIRKYSNALIGIH